MIDVRGPMFGFGCEYDDSEESSRLRRAMSWSYFLSLKIRYVKARTKLEVQRL
jgi:hypothetical protein